MAIEFVKFAHISIHEEVVSRKMRGKNTKIGVQLISGMTSDLPGLKELYPYIQQSLPTPYEQENKNTPLDE